MTDSSDMTITWGAILERATFVAREYMPDMPKQNTFDAWESFQSEVENLDPHEIAHESCEWNWVIYYARAMELCQAVPPWVLDNAESEFEDMSGFENMETPGLYELAVQLAAIIVTREIAEAVETVKDELIELAETQMESF